MLLCPPTNTGAALLGQHLQSHCRRLSFIQTAAQEVGSLDTLGRSRCASTEHLFNCPRATGKLAPEPWLGKFTQKVIDTVVKVRTNGVVFLAWGSPAQKRCDKITGAKHLVLKSVHPSPLSAYKGEGFFNCNHFRKANDWLETRYGKDGVINWDLASNNQAPVNLPAAVLVDPVSPTAKQSSSSSQHETEDALSKNKVPKSTSEKEEWISGDDDADAIEALEELAKLDNEPKATL